MIYLDNAATTYPKPKSVYDVMDRVNREAAFNAGRGAYKAAREASRMIDDVKKKLHNVISDRTESQIVLSSSITISLNQVLKGISWKKGDVVYVTPYEHNAVARTLHNIMIKHMIEVKEMPLTDKLEIDLEKLEYLFSKDKPRCVCCNHLSNVTGYILPVKDVFAIAKRNDAITILDTAQSLGLVQIDADELNADIIAFAGHKSLYGPFGIGGYINYGKIKLDVVLTGGTGSDSLSMEMPNEGDLRYEPSSPNIVSVAGLSAALDNLMPEHIFKHEKQLTEYIVGELKKIEGVIVYEPPTDKHIGVVSFNIEGYKAEDVGMILDEDYDIAVRTGFHCAPYIHKYLKDEPYLGTVRVGIGQFTSGEDADKLIEAIKELVS